MEVIAAVVTQKNMDKPRVLVNKTYRTMPNRYSICRDLRAQPRTIMSTLPLNGDSWPVNLLKSLMTQKEAKLEDLHMATEIMLMSGGAGISRNLSKVALTLGCPSGLSSLARYPAHLTTLV